MLPNGPIFMEQLKHKEAIYWYSQALQQAPVDTMTVQNGHIQHGFLIYN